jgi:hypothetical protein
MKYEHHHSSQGALPAAVPELSRWAKKSSRRAGMLILRFNGDENSGITPTTKIQVVFAI